MRHGIKAIQRTLTESNSSRWCWFGNGDEVTVSIGAELTAHVAGIRRCGSPWSCAICSPIIRMMRAIEIDQMVQAAHALGWGVEFVTLTVRHRRGDDLAERFGVVSESFARSLVGAPWVRRRDRLSYVGLVRAVEVTWSPRNGWHPHVHGLMFFRRPLTDAERQDLHDWLHGRWSGICERKGFGTVLPEYVDVQPVQTAGALGEYLTTLEASWTPGLELARADAKRSKGDKGVTPFQLLEALAETGELQWANLWREYEKATFGRKAIVVTPAMRAELLGDGEGSADEDLAAVEGADLAIFRRLYEKATWTRLALAGAVPHVLTELEAEAGYLLLVADLLGYQYPTIPQEVPAHHG